MIGNGNRPTDEGRGAADVEASHHAEFHKSGLTGFIETKLGADSLRSATNARLGKPAMLQLLIRFQKDQSGATTVEYGLIAVGIFVAIIKIAQGLETNLNTTFSAVSGALK